MKPVAGANQLRSDPQSVTRRSYRAFEHVSDTQRLGNRRDVFFRALVLERRRPCRDEQIRRTRQRIQDLFGQAVGKPLLLLVRGHVDERQHGDGLLFRPWLDDGLRLCRRLVHDSFGRIVARLPLPHEIAHGHDQCADDQEVQLLAGRTLYRL